MSSVHECLITLCSENRLKLVTVSKGTQQLTTHSEIPECQETHFSDTWPPVQPLSPVAGNPSIMVNPTAPVTLKEEVYLIPLPRLRPTLCSLGKL